MVSQLQYNINIELNYTDNFQYRNCIRQLFYMECSPNEEDIDEETRDELTYDETSISRTMDILFDMTKDNEMFNVLYDLAAARMISIDRTIGQAVLFSYDYLQLFHKCLGCFLSNDFTNNNEYYLQLKQKLT